MRNPGDERLSHASPSARAVTCTARVSLRGRPGAGRGPRVGRRRPAPRDPGRRGRASSSTRPVAFWRALAVPVDVHRPLAGDAAALGDHAQADDLRPDGRRSSPPRPPGCRSRSAASATGTTATPGSATARSRSTPCWASASPRRPRRSAAGCATGCRSKVGGEGGPLNIMYRVDGSSDLEGGEPRALGGLPRLAARCASATGRGTSVQMDIYGEAMDSIYFADERGHRASTTAAGVALRVIARLARGPLGPAGCGHLGDPRRARRTSPTGG